MALEFSRRALLAGLMVTLFLVSGCGALDPGRSGFGRSSRPIRLQVENHHFLDVTVYALGNGMAFKLGEVTGKSSGSFGLDPTRIHMVSGLQLRVDPIGSNRNYLSPVLFVDRRSTVVLEVGSELEMSYVTIR